MKKLFIAALALCLTAFNASAQEDPGTFTLQTTSGINISNVTGMDSKAYVRFVGGIDFAYKFNKLLSLSLGAMYSGEGFTFADTYGKFRTDYIDVPVLANFYLYKGLALKTGVQPGFKINASSDGMVRSEAERLVNDVNFSIPFGISYEIAGVTFDFRYNMGVSQMFNTDRFDLTRTGFGSSRSSVFQLSLGYKILLHRGN